MEAGFLPPSFWRRAEGKELCTGATSQITSTADQGRHKGGQRLNLTLPNQHQPILSLHLFCASRLKKFILSIIKLQKHPQTNSACARMMRNVLKKQSR